MAVFSGNGSAVAPSFTFSSDTNTGIFRNGADGISMSCGGVEVFRAEAGGITNIFADTTGSALRITQVGTGDAFSIYDVAADVSPFVVNTDGSVIIGRAGVIRGAKVQTLSEVAEGISVLTYSNDGNPSPIEFLKSRGGVIGTNALVQNGDGLGQIRFYGADGTGATDWEWGSFIQSNVNGTAALDDMPSNLLFGTRSLGGAQPLQRMEIGANGNIGFGGSASTVSGTTFAHNITGGSSAFAQLLNGSIQTGVTNASMILTQPQIASGASVGNLFHFNVSQGVYTGTVTNQVGYYFPNITGASGITYGFASDLSAGAGHFGFWSNGTADCFFRGRTGVGAEPNTFGKFFISGSGALTGQTSNAACLVTATIASDVTASAFGFYSQLATSTASFTCSNLTHYYASPNVFGVGSSVTNQFGFSVSSLMTGATNNYAFYSDVASGADRWNLYMNGTAQNYLNGNLLIGGAAARATTGGTNILSVFNGTSPVGTLANGISFYSNAGEAYVIDAAGNATLISPHDTETNEWVFDSTFTPTGKRLRIRMEAMMKAINDYFGWDFIEEFAEPA